MIQLEFDSLVRVFHSVLGGVVKRCRPVKGKPESGGAGLSSIDYTLRLSSALRTLNLTHALHDVLSAVAKLEIVDGHATIAGVALRLGCTFQAVHLHLYRNPDLFRVVEGLPRQLRLSEASVKLLARIKERTRHE